MILNILLTLFLVSLNGFFVAAEFAIVKVRLSQIELRVRTGSKFAKLAKHLILHLDAYLSATQLGITLASLGLGWIGEPIVAVIIIDVMNFFGFTLTEQLAHSIALPVAFAIITVLHIVFGELAPKSLAIQRSEQVALIVALPLRFFYIIFSPFIWILNNLANFFLKLIGFEPVTETEGLHSADELRYLLEESSKSGVIGVSEQKLLDNVFDLPNTPIKHIMVPRGRIFGVDFSMSSNEILEKFINEGYSRMPIYDKTIDNIIGVIYAKDVISILRYPNLIIVKDIIRPAFFVHEEEKINKLLHDMQRNKVHLAIVLDDFGGTAGLVTLEDIIEEIVGEIQDEYDEEVPLIEKLNEFEFLVHTSSTIDDANEFLPIPLPEDEDYETVGGLIISLEGRIPESEETIELDDYYCTIVKRSERFIELVKLKVKQVQVDEEN